MLLMKPLRFSLLSCALFSASGLLTACDDGSKPSAQAPSISSIQSQPSAFSLEQLAKLPSDSSAHWLTPTLLLLPKIAENNKTNVHYSLISVELVNSQEKISSLPLTTITLPENIKSQFPHLSDFQGYHLEITPAQAKKWLKHKLMVVAVDQQSQLQKIAYLQTGAVLDALYTLNGSDADEVTDLGARVSENSVTFKLWAPTAQKVELFLFNDDMTPAKPSALDMVEDSNTGIWQIAGDSSLKQAYYQYQITVYHPASKQVETLVTTDPYSLSLSINSKYSQVVDLTDPRTQPQNWQNHSIPTVKNIEDNIIYETHIRDFSANDQQLSNSQYRGKYKAFSEQNSSGIKHLKTLKASGLNIIHLLPTFDIATVNEDENQRIELNDSLAKVCQIAPEVSLCQPDQIAKLKPEQSLKSLLKSFAGKGEQVQSIVSELRQVDNYNWGYDPYHYTVPEGSYALNPQGVARLVEFRAMVQSLHQLGFRVIMDVVYNHTHQSGLEPNAVLDKIVPNYYHRLHPLTGAIEQSTCCDNTATERVMMAKLMTDSLVVWARDYKIDGFRFDLMGHQPKTAMLKARAAVRKVDSDTYFYGEGWNFGEVANNRQFTQASQLELGGSEIGTYSDRLRDAVRGPGNNTRSTQGIGNGLLTLPNELQTKEQSVKEYQLRMDQLRIGLAANLANFPLTNAQGQQVLGKDIPYGDQPTGYALDPADTINYVSKHDNQTLWDNSQYRTAFDVSTDDRVRMQLQSLSFTLLAQGIPFLHMGSEFLRSKSFLRDSYDYGDWFNGVDFSKQDNFYNVGLPPAEKDQANWPLIIEVLAKNQGRDQVNSRHIQFSSAVFNELLALRMSSPLFRLTTAEAIIEQVSFLNTGSDQQTGLLVMKLDEAKLTSENSVDKNYQSIVVVFNTSGQQQTFNYPQASDYLLHPIQQNSIDQELQNSTANAKGFTVPALSFAVFVKPRA